MTYFYVPGKDERPTCRVCMRPVERWTTWTDFLRSEYVYLAECHGDREETRLERTEVAGAERITIGECFVAPRLAALPLLLLLLTACPSGSWPRSQRVAECCAEDADGGCEWTTTRYSIARYGGLFADEERACREAGLEAYDAGLAAR